MLRCSELSYQSKGERLPTFKKEKFISIVNVLLLSNKTTFYV